MEADGCYPRRLPFKKQRRYDRNKILRPIESTAGAVALRSQYQDRRDYRHGQTSPRECRTRHRLSSGTQPQELYQETYPRGHPHADIYRTEAMIYSGSSSTIPCAKCSRGSRKEGYGQWVCSQPGFRPRPISQVKNCTSLNNYRKRTSGRY